MITKPTFKTQGYFSVIMCAICLFVAISAKSQSFFTPADTLSKPRFNSMLIIGAATYSSFSYGLYTIWYQKYPQESFHLFNDWGEWQYMDKLGHAHTAYLQGLICYKGAKWTGLNHKKSLLTGVLCGTLFQSTIEVMDGFSSEWGFSGTDMAANILGIGIFASQQYYWNDQRISLKVSSLPISHPNEIALSTDGNESTTINTRAKALFGSNYFERYLKDYNAQTYWASINVHSFLPKGNQWPSWLNVAVGYGAQNMYGGYANTWALNGHNYSLDSQKYPRYRQFYLGLDVDLTKLHPRSPFLKTVCSVFNIFKVPSPALEINTKGEFVFHLFR